MSNVELLARRSAAVPRGISVAMPFFVARAENSEVWDVEGRRYIDFASGIAVLNTGHRHPRVVAAVREQLDKVMHSAYQVAAYEPYVELAEKLNRIVPGHPPKKTAFFSTGAEAVENAVKIARAATKRRAIVAMSGAFHGRTLMAMALTGKTVPYKAGLGPLPGHVYHIPFPVELHNISIEDSLHALQTLFKVDVEPAEVAAVILEPVQGEGGFYVAPQRYLEELREICAAHGILFIADEIQTGFGRTGKMFALDGTGVVPDLVVTAKSLAGGLPLSAVTGRAELMDAPGPGGLGGTYAGNPLSLAAALAVLDVMEEDALPQRGARLGRALVERLQALQPRVPAIAEVRGLGAMIAVELMKPGKGEPDPDAAKRVQTEALARGLILLTCGVYSNVIRFLFPLTIEDGIFAEALDILEACLLAL